MISEGAEVRLNGSVPAVNSMTTRVGGRSGSLPRLRPISAEQVALIPRCAECLAVWLPDDDEHWRAYLDLDDNLVFYCPGCAEREFGDD